MSYFQSTAPKCTHYPQEWDEVLAQIKGWGDSCSFSTQVSQPLEAKALYMFTIARRLMRTAQSLVECKDDWKSVFIEGTILLFPMLELMGHARLDATQVRNQYGGKNDVTSVDLWAGLHWIRDVNYVPQVNDNKQGTDTTALDRWQIGHLVSLRNFLLHGSKNARDNKGRQIPIEDVISFEFPGFIVEKAQPAMMNYWRQLKQDNGSQYWLQRLARADIRPLKIEGSVFEKGLVDPDIVDCLEGREPFLGKKKRLAQH